MKYQKEVLLRDIFEFIPACTYIVLSLLLVIASELAFTIPVVAIAIAVLFSIRGLFLLNVALKLRRYQKNITQLKMYQMKSSDLPVSQNVHFLGMGFEWTAKHTQRVYDINQPKNAKFRELSKAYKCARQLEIDLEHKKWAQRLLSFTSSQSQLNPVAPVPPLEGESYLHSVGLYEKEERIFQSLGNRVGHTWVQGTTRVGKTRLAELIIAQDIARGDVTIVMDPKGDAELFMRCYSEAVRAGREDDFYFFHLGFPEISAQYNPVGEFMRITEVATRIANQMPGEGQSAAFKEFVWGFVNQVSKGLVGIGKTPTYPLIKSYSQNLDPLYIEFMDMLLEDKIKNYREEIQTVIQLLLMKAEERRKAGFMIDTSGIKRDKEALARYCIYKQAFDSKSIVLTMNEEDIAQSLTKAFITDQQYLSKLVASLDPFLEKMTSEKLSELISPNFIDPNKDTFDWGSIIQSGGIVYVGLDALSDQEVARAVGASMLADLTSQYGRIYKEGRDSNLQTIDGKEFKYAPIRIHIDEGNEPADKSLIPSLNKAGGAGVSVTLYTQTSSDLEARLGSKAFANQMLGNFNTIISFRVQDEDTALIFTQKQREVTVSDFATFSSASDSSDINSDVDFTSSTQSRIVNEKVPMITTEDLTKLPKGQFYVMMDGNKLYKCRVPWLTQDADELPSDIRDIAKRMREGYQSDIPNWYSYKEYFDINKTLNADVDYDAANDFLKTMKENYSEGQNV